MLPRSAFGFLLLLVGAGQALPAAPALPAGRPALIPPYLETVKTLVCSVSDGPDARVEIDGQSRVIGEGLDFRARAKATYLDGSAWEQTIAARRLAIVGRLARPAERAKLRARCLKDCNAWLQRVDEVRANLRKSPAKRSGRICAKAPRTGNHDECGV
jgi:hypothetical protein